MEKNKEELKHTGIFNRILDLLPNFKNDKNNLNKYNRAGFDIFGYDKDGFDRYGFDRSGYDKLGYNSSGYDSSGYDRQGFDKSGFNKEGRNKNGTTKTFLKMIKDQGIQQRKATEVRRCWDRWGQNTPSVQTGSNDSNLHSEVETVKQKIVQQPQKPIKSDKKEEKLKEADKKRVKRIINDYELLMTFSGMRFWDGSIADYTENRELTREYVINQITFESLFDLLSGIIFDSDHYYEDMFLAVRCRQLKDKWGDKYKLYNPANLQWEDKVNNFNTSCFSILKESLEPYGLTAIEIQMAIRHVWAAVNGKCDWKLWEEEASRIMELINRT